MRILILYPLGGYGFFGHQLLDNCSKIDHTAVLLLRGDRCFLRLRAGYPLSADITIGKVC